MASGSNTEQAKADVSKSVTVIGSNVVVEDGRIIVVNDLVVYGAIDADVVAGGRVVVAGGGTVSGRIEADSIAISGVVHGEVHARNSFRLEETGELYGTAGASSFAVAPGSAGEFQLKMQRESLAADLEQVSESRVRYEEALKSVSELTGKVQKPSSGYLDWYDKQTGGPKHPAETNDEAVPAERQPNNRSDSDSGSDGAAEEIRIDIDANPQSSQSKKKRFAGEQAVGRAAWSKSIGDELSAAQSGQLALSKEETELLAGGDPHDEGSEEAGSTDAMLNSSKLREAVDSVRNHPDTADPDQL